MIFLLALTTISWSCKKKDNVEDNTNIIPVNFSVDIPDALSYSSSTKSVADVEPLNGNVVYFNLKTFINVGEKSAEIIQKIFDAIREHNLTKPTEFDFTGNEDGRAKHCKIEKNGTYNGTSYSYKLTITDKLNESKSDGGKAIQVFWNAKPVDGVAILKFININVNTDNLLKDALAKIEYNEKGIADYDQEMTVSICKMLPRDTAVDKYSITSLKMFVGRKGDIIDVYGNSNHPNAWFIIDNPIGYNWAFVASSDRTQKIGIAEVGLPVSELLDFDRAAILETNSIKNVFNAQIKKKYPNLPQTYIDNYLKNTDAPGYFSDQSFVQAGTAPSANYTTLYERTKSMKPYQPWAVTYLTINFQ